MNRLLPVPFLIACSVPVVTDLRVQQDNYVATVIYDVDDPDADLEGGVVELRFDGKLESLDIGTDRVRWADGVLSIDREFSPCFVGEVVEVSATVIDAAGHRGRPYRGEFELEGYVLDEVEPNRWFYDVDPRPIDYLDYGLGLCGMITHVGVSDYAVYTGDVDIYRVVAREDGQWRVALDSLATGARFDLWEVERDEQEAHYADDGDTSFMAFLSAGSPLYVGVAAAHGTVGDYSITFRPE